MTKNVDIYDNILVVLNLMFFVNIPLLYVCICFEKCANIVEICVCEICVCEICVCEI